MKVMIDTNILISAALFPNGRVAAALMKALLPPFQPVVCDYVVDELIRKFREKFPDKMVKLEAFLFTALNPLKWSRRRRKRRMLSRKFVTLKIDPYSERH